MIRYYRYKSQKNNPKKDIILREKKNVFVHQFVCKDTIEEKINEMLISKTRLAKSVIGGIGDTGENLLTKMSDHELIEALRME